MPEKKLRHFADSPLVLFAAGALLALFFSFSALYAAMRARIENSPFAVEARAPMLGEPAAHLGLYDGAAVRQTFLSPVRKITHIGVAISAMGGGEPQGKVSLKLMDASGNVLAETSVAAADLRFREATEVPLEADLRRGGIFSLSLTTNGVPRENALSVHYDRRDSGFAEGELFVAESGGKETPREGNIFLQVIRKPTVSVVFDDLSHSPVAYILALLTLAAVFAVSFAPARRPLCGVLCGGIRLSVGKPGFRESIGIFFIAAALAAFVTAPFYGDDSGFNTMGDVSRMLVFRGLGREAALSGAIARWDPYLCGGNPLLANIESPFLDPFFLFTLAFGELLGLKLSVTAALIAGFTGAYFLARRYTGAGRIASVLAGLVFCYSGFQMLALSAGIFAWIPVGWVPWFIYFYLRAVERNSYLPAASLCFSFMLLGGGPHMPLFSAIAALLLGIFLAAAFRSIRPLWVGIAAIFFAALIAAVKLLPALELQSILDGFNRPEVFVPPLEWFSRMFIEHDISLLSYSWVFGPTGERFRWKEFGAYIGAVPFVLALFGALSSARGKVIAVFGAVSAALLALTFGLFPWRLIAASPVIGEIFRNPQRIRSVLLLFVGILAAFGLARAAGFLRNRMLAAGISLFAIGFVAIDLLGYHAPLFRETFDLPLIFLPRQETFVRVQRSFSDQNDSGYYYRAGYINYLANIGTTDLCVPNILEAGNKSAVGSDNDVGTLAYYGEAYFPRLKTQAKLERVDTSSIEVSFPRIDASEWLVLNQNYYPGWTAAPSRRVGNYKGLLAVLVEEGDTETKLEYRPLSYAIGLWVTLAAIFLAALSLAVAAFRVIKNRPKGRR